MASTSSRPAIAIIPTPRLNTRRISPSDTRPGGHRGGAGRPPPPLPPPTVRPRHIVLPRLVRAGKLRRLAPRQRHVVRAAAARHPGDERRGDVGLELSRRDVVEQRERPRPVHQDVVHAVIHEILTYGVVDPGPGGDEQLGPDAVGRQDEHGVLVPRWDAHHAAERADLAERERRPRAAHQLGDAALRLPGGVEPDARRRVAVGHGPAGPFTSKWTSCLNACTRARTAAGVTLSNPWIPNASTANDPMAAPYTIARRRFGAERSPFRARWAMKPPANASPAPVGSNTSWSG